MSDVGVAFISMAGSGLVAVTTAYVAVASSNASKNLELERIRAENARLHDQATTVLADERRVIYLDLLSVLSDLAVFAVAPPGNDVFFAKTEEWRQLRPRLELTGATAVRDAMEPIKVLLTRAVADAGDPTVPGYVGAWASCMRPELERFSLLRTDLARAMKTDIASVS